MAASAADEVSSAATYLHGQARDGASQVADATTTAARQSAGSFEQALRNTIENQPYTAVAIALGLLWMAVRETLGRCSRDEETGIRNFRQ